MDLEKPQVPPGHEDGNKQEGRVNTVVGRRWIEE